MTEGLPAGRLLAGDRQYRAFQQAWMFKAETNAMTRILQERYPDYIFELHEETPGAIMLDGRLWRVERVESPDYLAVADE